MSLGHLRDHLDLDGDAEGQLGHPDGRAGVATDLFAEELDEEVGAAIDHSRGFWSKPGAQFTIPSTLTLLAYGVELAGPYRAAGTALDGCPCLSPTGCRHVPTRPTPGGVPLQLDRMLTTRAGAVEAKALPIEPGYSDHAPILIDIRLDRADHS